METGDAIPIPQNNESQSSNKSILLEITEDNDITMNMDGEFSIQELVGTLGVSLIDIIIKQFINPNFAKVLENQNASHEILVSHISEISNSGKSADELDDILSVIQSAIKNRKGG